MNYLEINQNSFSVPLQEIPVLEYEHFFEVTNSLLQKKMRHCVNYFCFPYQKDFLKFIIAIADDETSQIAIFSHEWNRKIAFPLRSLTELHYPLHIYEREIYENFGVHFISHPWLKPVRWVWNRADKNKTMNNYPFFKIEGGEIHEVGVGPIHAGVIEPGHFRFLCNGERVLHLEIHLGYQHRGVEELFLTKKSFLQRSVLAENIAGDTAIGHEMAFAAVVEKLSQTNVSEELEMERSIAIELERIALHIGDTANMCTGIAYQLGQVTNEALRTVIINTTQFWCGNRFGKGLIRILGTNYPLKTEVIDLILRNLVDVDSQFNEVASRIYSLPSVLSRYDGIGVVTQKQAELIGAVGMAARMSGIPRDIRSSHPFSHFKKQKYETITLQSGDVLARAILRKMEFDKSIAWLKEVLEKYPILQSRTNFEKPNYSPTLSPNHFALSLVEGWRGEICHCAITDSDGEILHYKIKDPSLHNWMALALAVRNLEISDFPINNKSFNLSYCGYDL